MIIILTFLVSSMGKKKKSVIQKEIVSPQKTPSKLNLSSDDSGHVVWSFSLADNEGRWGFKGLSVDELHSLIFDKLVSKESLNWNEIKANKSHHVATSKLIKEAQIRLKDLNMDDLDELFSLRLTGIIRVWGVKQENVLRLLWWDPHHEICPSRKKHT